MGAQTLIWACKASAGMRRPPGGKPGRALAVRSRWRSRLTRRRARLAGALSRFAVIAGAPRLGPASGHGGRFSCCPASFHELLSWRCQRPLPAVTATGSLPVVRMVRVSGS